MRRSALVPLALLLLLSGGCRLHMEHVFENQSPAMDRYRLISVARDDRATVLRRLGPPDEMEFLRDGTVVFDYVSSAHRQTRLESFVPSEIFPFVDPLFILAIPRFFFDPSGSPDEFDRSTAESAGRGAATFALRLVPFTSGEELLIVKGHQIRADRLRVLFEPERRIVAGKSLRLATGEYQEDSLVDRVILRAD